MRFEDVIRTKDGFERRQWLRFDLPKSEDLVLVAQGKKYLCQIIDISLGGARVAFKGAVPPPTRLGVNHDEAGEFYGTCKWLNGRTMGIEFDLTEPSLLLASKCLKQAVPDPRQSVA